MAVTRSAVAVEAVNMHLKMIRLRAAIVSVAIVQLITINAPAQDLTAKLAEYMNGVAQGSFSGTVLVSRGGKVLFVKGYGNAKDA